MKSKIERIKKAMEKKEKSAKDQLIAQILKAKTIKELKPILIKLINR